MINELKKIFPSLCFKNEVNNDPEKYSWFITDDNKIIGIDKKELSPKNEEILSTFLTPHHISIPQPTELEQRWNQRIQTNFSNESVHTFRFVYFSTKTNQMEPQLFKEAIHNFYTNPVAIIWENDHQGVIVEEKPEISDEPISYEQMIEVLMSDLYINIRFCIGPYMNTLARLNDFYTTFIKEANIAFHYADQAVVTYVDVISYLFVHQAEKEFLQKTKDIVLGELAEDHDLLHSIKVFILSNQNVTTAAKKLHLHRNSLQYRLDKFIDKTGIDVRQFNGAMAVYLTILSMVHKN
ncbi:CdaR family transcriptional regulator [Oceanobacillus sp. Castelsardo]|uniref:PucR family transcriptional regulator n=1 Tax=Oceanobacillus sp. Castelsardo TaxID=1851204 RepID=UPI0008399658|nr:helix-turn-helix domain-containing protein [Oceanobacillus sp. Castelsardo]